jgi:hypothetical protein
LTVEKTIADRRGGWAVGLDEEEEEDNLEVTTSRDGGGAREDEALEAFAFLA